jgi:hypothetical protein
VLTGCFALLRYAVRVNTFEHSVVTMEEQELDHVWRSLSDGAIEQHRSVESLQTLLFAHKPSLCYTMLYCHAIDYFNRGWASHS